MSSNFDEVLKFIPALKDDGFGKWIIDHENDGSPEHPIHFPFVSYSRCVKEFEQAIYDFKENNPDFELNKYREILSESGIDWNMNSMETADVSNLDAQTIMALLISIVRAERFCDGALLSMLKSGAILRWLDRLHDIAEKEN